MPIVTGQIRDFGLQPLSAFRPELVFHPSGPGLAGSRILGTKPIIVRPFAQATGSFSVELQSTESLLNDVWYRIELRWLNTDGTFVSKDLPDWKVRVPIEGGALVDMLDAPVQGGLAWIGETPPPQTPVPGMWWLVPSTGELKEWV